MAFLAKPVQDTILLAAIEDARRGSRNKDVHADRDQRLPLFPALPAIIQNSPFVYLTRRRLFALISACPRGIFALLSREQRLNSLG